MLPTRNRNSSSAVYKLKEIGSRKKSDYSENDPDTTISEFESPKKSQPHSDNSESTVLTDFSDNLTRKRPREKKTLLQQIKQAKAIYESSYKCFLNGNKRKNENDSSSLMRLVVLKCVSENTSTLALSQDFDSKSFKWVLFKPRKSLSINPGVYVKLFQPWQEILVKSLEGPVVVCTDFYHLCDSREIGIKESIMEKLISSANQSREWQSFVNGDHTATLGHFSEMVPYSVKNNNTIAKQMAFHKSSINLDVVICQIWKTPEYDFVLIRDSDNWISALEISHNEKITNVLTVGTLISFSNLSIREKVTTWSYMPLFSVISLYGSRQNVCYKLGMEPNSYWKKDESIDIPFLQKVGQNKTLLEISKMGDQDCRFNVRAKAKYLNPSQLIIWDDSTNLKGKLEIIPAYENQFPSSTNEMECIDLEYVRFFRGKLSIDRFSTMKLCSNTVEII